MRATPTPVRRAIFGLCARALLLLPRAMPASILCVLMPAPSPVVCVPQLLYSLDTHVLLVVLHPRVEPVPLSLLLHVHIVPEMGPVPCSDHACLLYSGLVPVVLRYVGFFSLVLLSDTWM
jgi:hypothetical protein